MIINRLTATVTGNYVVSLKQLHLTVNELMGALDNLLTVARPALLAVSSYDIIIYVRLPELLRQPGR